MVSYVGSDRTDCVFMQIKRWNIEGCRKIPFKVFCYYKSRCLMDMCYVLATKIHHDFLPLLIPNTSV